MAGYNRGIVATRKLNERNKARLESTGDTEFGVIKGRLSHINWDEKRRLTAADAYDISLRERVESDIAEKGAGTINPFTGMPEYHEVIPEENHPTDHTHGTSGDWMNTYTDYSKEIPTMAGDEPYTPPTGRQDYEKLSDMTSEQLEAYLKSEFDMGEDSMKYIEGFQEEPFVFLGQAQALATDRAGDIRGFQERGLQSAYGATMGALGSQEKTLGLQGEGLTAQQTALGRTAGRGLRGFGRGRDIAASRSGLATSGTVTQSYEAQKRDLFQDYTAGTQDISRQRAGIGIGMEDIGRQRGTALEQLTLGKEEAAATEQATISGADLDFRTSEYLEKKRQLDALYTDVGVAAEANASDRRLKENVDYIGDSPSGIKMYEFNYLNNDTRHRGVMADDLVDSHPKALSKDEDGYYMVDYSQIDVNFEIIKED